jgi:serine/threonine-protein kinase
MIAGSRPVTGEDARIIAMRVERGEVVPLIKAAPEVPREVAGLVHRAMAARPELRFATATEMRIALDNAVAGRRSMQSLPGTPSVAAAPVGPAASDASSAMPAKVPDATARANATGTIRNLPAISVVQAGRTTMAGQTPVGVELAPEAGPPNTQRAPPIATAMGAGPPPYGAISVPSAPAASDPRARGGKTWALIALPLLLGAGIVGVLIATGAWVPSGGDTPTPTLAPQALAEAGAPSATNLGVVVPTIPTVSPGVVPTLQQPRPIGPTLPHPSASHSGQATAAADAGGGPNPNASPPFVFPSSLPSFPGVIPLPSGFPTAFPSVLPAWPPPAPAPAPSAASSASVGPGY